MCHGGWDRAFTGRLVLLVVCFFFIINQGSAKVDQELSFQIWNQPQVDIGVFTLPTCNHFFCLCLKVQCKISTWCAGNLKSIGMGIVWCRPMPCKQKHHLAFWKDSELTTHSAVPGSCSQSMRTDKHIWPHFYAFLFRVSRVHLLVFDASFSTVLMDFGWPRKVVEIKTILLALLWFQFIAA